MSERSFLARLLDRDRRLSTTLSRPLQAPSGLPWRVVRKLAIIGARAGDGLLWASIGVLAYLLSGPEKRQGVIWVALSILVAGVITAGIKVLTHRRRPATLEDRSSFYGGFDAYAFPSGHACRMACIAVTIGALNPRLTIPFWLLALWVMVSRVLLGIHHVLDIVVGGLVGVIVGSLAMRIFPPG